MNNTIKILGFIIFTAIGVFMVINPGLVGSIPVPDDPYESIERRSLWGILIGLGALFLVLQNIRPWLHTIVAILASVPFGVIIARLIGTLIDGSVAKQWLWILIELIMLIALVWWYMWLKRRQSNI